MASKIKIYLTIKKTGCVYEFKVPSLGVDGFTTSGFGDAVDRAVREVNSFFKGLISSEDGLRRLDVSSVPDSLTLELGFRVVKEACLSDFSLSDISGESSDVGGAESDQKSCTSKSAQAKNEKDKS